nr:hypothetical transcript [Hymenolepis microstoma]
MFSTVQDHGSAEVHRSMQLLRVNQKHRLPFEVPWRNSTSVLSLYLIQILNKTKRQVSFGVVIILAASQQNITKKISAVMKFNSDHDD